ncbi:MAG: hypothetical protein RLY70_2840 [Planctomycetota bacterium]|jgi:hypothetical protein
MVPATEDKPAAQAAQAIKFAAPFRDHAILQRNLPLPVRGWSEPGTSVMVTITGRKETAIVSLSEPLVMKAVVS